MKIFGVRNDEVRKEFQPLSSCEDMISEVS